MSARSGGRLAARKPSVRPAGKSKRPSNRPSRKKTGGASSGRSLDELPEDALLNEPADVPAPEPPRRAGGGTFKFGSTKDGGQARLFGSVVVDGRLVGSKSQSSNASRKERTKTPEEKSGGAPLRASDSSQNSDNSRKFDSLVGDETIALDAESCREYLEGLKSDLALQLEINKLELLASLVPARIIRHHMSQSTGTRVFAERFQAAVLFADISGFSNLAERLVKEIKHVAYAAENLSRYIGASLEQMVATIANKGGDVIKFAGDAILAVFPVEEFGGSLEEATLCCCQVAMELVAYDFRVAGRSKKADPQDGEDEEEEGRSGHQGSGNEGGKKDRSHGADDAEDKEDGASTTFTRMRSDSGSVIKLSVHCGVGCGTVISYHVGGLNDRWEYVVTGSPVEQIGAAEPEAAAGQTVVSKQTLELIGDQLRGSKLPSGNFLLSGFPSRVPSFPNRELVFAQVKAFTSANPLQYKRLQDLLCCYVPSPALVSIDSGNGIWAGELRVCSTVFCRLLGLKYEGKESDITTIQDSFSIVHKHVLNFEGTLLRFIVDDKGAGVLTAFGLPPKKHENDSVRAVKASMGVLEELEELRKDRLKWKVGCSIGITTGEVFCGTVGGQLRCEYTLHGVKVNLAARLMVSAKRGILCDKQTFRESAKYIKFGRPHFIRIKGKQTEAEVYRPRTQKLVISIDHQIQSRQVGRATEEGLVKRLLRNVLDPLQPVAGTLIVTGDAGMGKTRLCQYALSKAKSRPFLTLVARGDDTEMHTPFFLWKSIVPQLLQYFVGESKLSHLSADERMQLLEARVPVIDALSLVNGPRDSFDEDANAGPGNDVADGSKARDDEDDAEDAAASADATSRRKARRSAPPKLDVAAGPDGARAAAPDTAHDLSRSRAHADSGDSDLSDDFADRSGPRIGRGGADRFRDRLRELFPLLRRILPDFFQLGGGASKDRKDAANSEVTLVNLLRLIVEIFAKAAHDLESAQHYFDVESNKISENRNVVRLVIIVEDLQWADPYSVEALYRMAERGLPIAVIITCRETMMSVSATQRLIPSVEASPVGDVLGDWYQKISAHPSSTKVALKPLNLQQIQTCLKNWINAESIPPRLTRVVFDKSQGHPFFAAELCKLMTDDNVFTVEDNVCILSKDAQGDDFGLPSTISALMTSRLDRIPASQQLTLKVAAVIGNEFRMHVLASVLLSYTGADENEESVLEDDSRRSAGGSSSSAVSGVEAAAQVRRAHVREEQRKTSLARNNRSSYNHERMMRALQDDEVKPDPVPNRSRNSGKPPARAAVAAAGDLREISKLLDENISHLVDRGFLVAETDSNGDSIIRFSSVMLRESAYNLLLFKMRKAIHIKVAEFYEEKYADYLQPVYLRLANHYFSAESHDRATYYLEVAGDDALEIHSMQAVWLCFTRLIATSRKASKRPEPWKRASWFRKVSEAYMFFGQSKAAEEYLKGALDELKLDVTGIFAQPHGAHGPAAKPRRRSWLSKLLKQDPDDTQQSERRAPSAGSGKERPSSAHSENPRHESGARKSRDADRTATDIARNNELKLLKHQESSALASGHSLERDLTMNSANDKSLNRGAYVVRHQRGRGAGADGAGGPDASVARGKGKKADGLQAFGEQAGAFGPNRTGARLLEDLARDDEAEAPEPKAFTFFKRLFRDRVRKHKLRSRQAEVQRAMNTYRRVEDAPAFDKIRVDPSSNVEAFLEASRIYSLLGSLIFDQTSALGLERRLNAMSLAKAAYKCSIERDGPPRRRNDADGGSVVLDLDEHKVESRALDPEAASLDQLALCFASASLFYIGMSKDWAREIANDYMSKTLGLLPQVRASSAKGRIALQLGEFFILNGDFADAEHYLKQATWVFNFLEFHRDKLESLETHITLELFRAKDMRNPVVMLSRSLFQDGVGIFHVNCLCAYVELSAAGYGVAHAYLQQILETTLDFTRSHLNPRGSDGDQVTDAEREQLADITVMAADSHTPDGLIVLALLVLRRYGKRDIAVQLAKMAASIARAQEYDHLPITRFHMLVAIFRIYMESFSDYVDRNSHAGASSASGATDEGCLSPKGGTGYLSRRLSSAYNVHSLKRKSSIGAESSEPGTVTGVADRLRKNERNPKFRYPSQRDLGRRDKGGDRRGASGSEARFGPWKRIHRAAVSRKQSINTLQALLDIIDAYADKYAPCKPYAAYCDAVFHRVKAAKSTPKVKALLEKCAELAHNQGMQHLKCTALMELGIARREPAVLVQLHERFHRMHALYEERRSKAEVTALTAE